MFAYRGAVAFRTYNPAKPARYGILFKCANEVLFPYVYRAEPFLGKPRDIANATEYYVPNTLDITLRLVDKIAEFQDLTGVHFTFDNFYTSIPLALALLDRDIAMTGNLTSYIIGYRIDY